MLALENHWGPPPDVETLLGSTRAVRSPWLGINLDTGNWPGDPYEGIEALAPLATIVQAKTYHGGGVWYTLDLDYPRIARILQARPATADGCRSRWRARRTADTAVPKSLATLRDAFSRT